MLGSTPPESPVDPHATADGPLPPRVPRYLVIRVPRWRTIGIVVVAIAVLVATPLWWYKPWDEFHLGFQGGSHYFHPTDLDETLLERISAPLVDDAWLVTFEPGAEFELGFDISLEGPRPVKIVDVIVGEGFFDHIEVRTQDNSMNPGSRRASRALVTPVTLSPQDIDDFGSEALPILFRVRLPECSAGLIVSLTGFTVRYRVNHRTHETFVPFPFEWGVTDPDRTYECPVPQ
jgi:hypothetical protein